MTQNDTEYPEFFSIRYSAQKQGSDGQINMYLCEVIFIIYSIIFIIMPSKYHVWYVYTWHICQSNYQTAPFASFTESLTLAHRHITTRWRINREQFHENKTCFM